MPENNTNEDSVKNQTTLNAALDAIANDFIITDSEGNIKYINLKAKSNLFSGIYKEYGNFIELVEKMCELYPVDDCDKLIELTKKVSRHESFLTEKLKVTITKSIKKIYEVYTSPINDLKLGYLGRVWQFTDITLQENIDSIKSEFISIASHQLRTPLTSIRGYVTMILDKDYGEINSGILEPLKYIEKAAREMAALINDLLNISRIERNVVDEPITEFNFDEMISELAEMFDKRIWEKRLHFEYLPFKHGLIVCSDKSKVNECFKNLIDNAIKYNSEGGTVKITTSEVNGHSFQVEIADNGVGIPEDQQDRIFEKFFRAANVLTENFDGTGLGLYYVKESLAKLGGTISFVSKVNQGTTFTVTLPIKVKGRT